MHYTVTVSLNFAVMLNVEGHVVGSSNYLHDRKRVVYVKLTFDFCF